MAWYRLEVLIREELSCVSGAERDKRIAALLEAIAEFQTEEK